MLSSKKKGEKDWCLHMGKINWHDRAYVNPLLILEANWASLQKPKIFSPSICAILVVKDEPNAYFKITFASYFGHLIGLLYEREAHSY
jgi:hypothetical protein